MERAWLGWARKPSVLGRRSYDFYGCRRQARWEGARRCDEGVTRVTGRLSWRAKYRSGSPRLCFSRGDAKPAQEPSDIMAPNTAHRQTTLVPLESLERTLHHILYPNPEDLYSLVYAPMPVPALPLSPPHDSRSLSPAASPASGASPASNTPVAADPPQPCQWEGCDKSFPDPETLYSHLCNDHIGRKSTNNLCLTCKWKDCQTSCAKRDHITSHLRGPLVYPTSAGVQR